MNLYTKLYVHFPQQYGNRDYRGKISFYTQSYICNFFLKMASETFIFISSFKPMLTELKNKFLSCIRKKDHNIEHFLGYFYLKFLPLTLTQVLYGPERRKK